MNIFYVHKDPMIAARSLCDKHIVKMILESVQLLSNNLPIDITLTKRTHIKHPCSLWVGKSQSNFNWLLAHTYYLLKEYTNRYNKIHKYNNWIEQLYNIDLYKNYDDHTEPPQCMPEQYKELNSVNAYRNYYINEKYKFAKWKLNNKPDWMISNEI